MQDGTRQNLLVEEEIPVLLIAALDPLSVEVEEVVVAVLAVGIIEEEEWEDHHHQIVVEEHLSEDQGPTVQEVEVLRVVIDPLLVVDLDRVLDEGLWMVWTEQDAVWVDLEALHVVEEVDLWVVQDLVGVHLVEAAAVEAEVVAAEAVEVEAEAQVKEVRVAEVVAAVENK